MSPNPIDPASALKKLFERRRSPKETAPEALFQAAPVSPPPAGPASSPGGKKPDFKPILQAGKKLFSSARGLALRVASRSGRQAGIVGVDVGHTAVKVVRLEPLDGSYRITAAQIRNLEIGVSEELAREALVKQHLQALKNDGFLSGPVVVNFHHQDSIVESIRLPKMPADELGQAVIWEAQERLSLKPDKSIIRYIVNGEATVEGRAQLEMLLIGAPKEPLMASWRSLAEMGVKVVAMEPSSLAAFYPLLRQNLWKPTEVVGHLEIGAKISHLSFIRDGAVRFNRSFPMGGDTVTQAIADYCQKEFAEAERLKREFGISKMALEEDRHEAGHEGEDRVKVSHALGLHLEQLVAEIEHSYRYFAFELGGTDAQHMDRLLITGGGGLLKYLPDFLNSRLSVPVEVVDPLRGLEMAPALKEELEPGSSQRLGAALGLALRSVNSKEKS